MTAISVIFASRGRPESLARTVSLLFDLAADPAGVEAIVAVDPDDEETRDARMPPRLQFWTAPERFGYQRLHDYLNPLAKMASGTWCLWFNDDMIMKTPGWDRIIAAQRPAILWPHANHVHHANIVPAWPRAWSDALGHVSPTTHMDTYLQRLGEMLNRHMPIPVEVVHDRADVTGHHDDVTYAEGRGLLGPEGMAEETSPEGVGGDAPWDVKWALSLAHDAAVIRGLL